MFLHVILFTREGCVSQHASQVTWADTPYPQADTPWADTSPGQTPLAGRHPPGRHPLADILRTGTPGWSMSGWYVSYWNAFLFYKHENNCKNVKLSQTETNTPIISMHFIV